MNATFRLEHGRLPGCAVFVFFLTLTLPSAAQESPLQFLGRSFLAGGKGVDFQEWQRIDTWRDGQGNLIWQTNRAFVELQTGMHFRENGEWKDSQESIEAYPEYIGEYNDPMAIFVSTNYAGANWIITPTNDIALVPGTNQYVSVSTINGGYVPDNIPARNEQYYVDNWYSREINIQYDGTTAMLPAQIEVSANVTNHIKIAVEDYKDEVYDSAVLLKAWSPCD